MATSIYFMKGGAGGGNPTAPGQDLLDAMTEFAKAFDRLQRHRAAMIQEKDAGADEDASFVTISVVYGFTNSSGNISSTTARAAFAEFDSMVGNSSAAILQGCARFKQ